MLPQNGLIAVVGPEGWPVADPVPKTTSMM
jgi:hypothetical protein